MPNYDAAPAGWAWGQCGFGPCCGTGHRSVAEAEDCTERHLSREPEHLRADLWAFLRGRTPTPVIVKPGKPKSQAAYRALTYRAQAQRLAQELPGFAETRNEHPVSGRAALSVSERKRTPSP